MERGQLARVHLERPGGNLGAPAGGGGDGAGMGVAPGARTGGMSELHRGWEEERQHRVTWRARKAFDSRS